MYNADLIPFDNLVRTLESNGYYVSVRDEVFGREHFRIAHVKGYGIVGDFAEPNSEYAYCDNRLAADHEKCYRTFSHCPYIIGIPCSQNETDSLISSLKFLGSEEGFQISNTFEYLEENPFPYEMSE